MMRVPMAGPAFGLSILAALGCPASAANYDVTGSDVVTVPAGSFDSIRAYDSSQVTVESGTTARIAIWALDQSHVTMNGGVVTLGDAAAVGDATFVMNGGALLGDSTGTELLARNNGTFYFNGGTAPRINAFNDTVFHMNGGHITLHANARDRCDFYFRGGTIDGYLFSSFGATVFLEAADFGPGYRAGQVIEAGDLPPAPENNTLDGVDFDLTLADGTQTTVRFRGLTERGSIPSNSWTGQLILVASEPPGCGPADATTDGTNPGDTGYGMPDGQVTVTDLTYFVESWIAGDQTIADLTTDGTNLGDTSYGVPDGRVTVSDLTYYVELWLAGCP